MKHIIKTSGLILSLAAVSGADAATSRISMTQTASRRLPSIPGYVIQSANPSSSVFSDAECIDAYTDCLKGPDVCGGDMEECTTNVLLHAKMPNCLSTLYQCSSNGINSLFGTSSVSALSTVAEKNSYGEVTRYTYPLDGSVLGQMVIGANISNMLPTDQCVRKYTGCLKRDSVCGENFELCTSFKEFKNQSINCASTLARCQSEGLIELFGSTNTAVVPNDASRIGTAITDGLQYAAANAVKTCYKTIDSCLVNACTANPWRCVESVSMDKINSADFIAGGTTDENTTNSKLTLRTDGVTSDVNLYETTGQDVRKFIKGKCLNQIGGNKSCYMTFLEKTPKDRDLSDIDNQEDVFSLAYAARKEYANTTIQDILKNFDARAKKACVKKISDCARRSCGGGLGSACYKLSRTNEGIHINTENNYNDIKTGCEAIVNTDANCQYAANSASSDGYLYKYADDTVFTTLFPKYEGVSDSDPIGAVASLDALLSTSYNDAALAQMKKQCANVAISCVKSLCGKDYVNCYRNRNDVKTDVYNTKVTTFDNSMNKVGGVLDYTIVTGLCINAVKDADVCDEHLRAEAVTLEEDQTSPTWGTNTVRNAWLTSAGGNKVKGDVIIGCKSKTGGEYCDKNAIAACNTTDEDGCFYDDPVSQSWSEYSIERSAENLFQEVLIDIERNAQSIYNAKLTAEQHMCVSNNNGGIRGSRDDDSTLQWVKLKSTKVPTNYATQGLKPSQFTNSDDLYGSFCRAKITVMSDDKDIQDNLGADSVAYFAVGDPFTCGSWISRSKLEEISKIVGERARKDAGEGSDKDKAIRNWVSFGGFTVGGVGTALAMNSLQKKGATFGGLLKSENNSYKTAEDTREAAKTCLVSVDEAKKIYDGVKNKTANQANVDEYNKAVDAANRALRSARSIKSKGNSKSNDDSNSNDNSIKDISFTRATYTPGSDSTRQIIYTLDQTNKRIIENAITQLKGVKSGNAKLCRDRCESALEQLQVMLDDDNPSRNISANVKAQWNAAVTGCSKDDKGSVNKDYEKKCKKINIEEYVFDELVSSKTTGNEAVQEKLNLNDENFETKLSTIEAFCESKQNATEEGARRGVTNLVSGAVGALAVGALANSAINSFQKVKYETAENEAIKDWMDNVGSKIKCYLGGEELGSYGEIISFDLD